MGREEDYLYFELQKKKHFLEKTKSLLDTLSTK